MAKSLGSWAGVTFTAPVPNWDPYSSAMTGISRRERQDQRLAHELGRRSLGATAAHHVAEHGLNRARRSHGHELLRALDPDLDVPERPSRSS
jgi:hypothetical protein